jgi:uncharacterized membrane protein
MFRSIKDIYAAQIELAKLEGIGLVSNLLAKTLSIIVQIMAIVIGVITVLVIGSLALGFALDDYMVGVLSFCLSLIVVSIGVIFLRKPLVVKPIKNLIIKTLYEDISK